MVISEKKGGVILNYITLICNVGIKFVYTPFLLYFLGQAGYGLYSLVMSIVGYMAMLDLGFGSAVTRYSVKYISANDKDGLVQLYSTLSLIYVLIGIVAFVICFSLSCGTDFLFGKAMTTEEISSLRIMILLCGINLLFTFPLQISSSVIIAYEKFIFKNLVQLFFVIFQPLIMILLMYFVHIKSVGAIAVVTACNFLTYLLYYLYSRNKLDFRFDIRRFDKGLVRKLLSFSLAMFSMTMFEKIQFQSGQFVLGMFQGANAVAIWGIAMIFILNFRSISTAITNVYGPTFYKYIFNKDDRNLSAVVIKMTRIQAFVLFTILFNFIIFGKDFIQLWAGEAYSSVYRLSLIMMVPMVAYLLLDFCYLIQIARNDLSFRIITLFGSFSLCFLVGILFFPISLETYALITAASFIIGQVFFVYIYIKKKTIIPLNIVATNIAKAMIVPIIFTLVSFFIYKLYVDNNITSFIISAAFYNLLLIIIYWGLSLNMDEKRLLLRKR